MMHGAIKRALQVAKMRSGQTQSANIPPRPQAPVPRMKDQPVDPTRSKSSQERKKFQDGGTAAPYGVIDLGDKVILGAPHGEPIELSNGLKQRVKQIAAKHGAWYEGDPKDVGPNQELLGGQDAYRGSWDDAVAKNVKGYPLEYLAPLFSNVDVNRPHETFENPQQTIFDSLLSNQAKARYFKDRDYDRDTLANFLKQGSEKDADLMRMAASPATKENLQKFFSTGEKLMWPENWQEYPNKLGKIAKRFEDSRNKFLKDAGPGVYVTGAGHIPELRNTFKDLKVIGGERAGYDKGGSIMFQKEEPPRKDIPLRPYEPRFNPKSGKLDAADRKDIGFYGPIKNPMTDHEITEYSSDRDFQYPTVYEGMSDKDRAAIMMAERLGKNAPKDALSDVDDRAYAQARKRKAQGRSPFYEPGKDPYPKWSPEQHWDEPTGMPKDDNLYYADGGTVERPTKMNDKVKHALDVALSETHPKRFHHTLARTGYADGGLPDMDTSPADLANEVPYTHEKALASQFDVAKSAPYKPKGMKLGVTKIAPPKKVGFHAPRGPRSDIGKLRLRKNISVKPKKLKFASGGHPEIDDALRLASRTMSDMAKHIGDEGVHGASMQQGSTSTIVKEKLPGKKSEVVYEHHAKTPTETETFASGGGAWTRKEGQNPEGGLNAKGRASAKAEGHNLKPPAPHPKTEKDAGRRKSFCSRMKGMKAKLTSSETANDPDSRINKSLRAWNCRADGGRLMHQDIIDALNLAQRRRHFADGGMGSAGPLGMAMPSRQSKSDYLRQLYQQELGRDADQGGLDYWTQQLNNGMSMDQVQQAFDQSQEGQAYNQRPPRFSNDPYNPHVGWGPNLGPDDRPIGMPGRTPDNPYPGKMPLNDVPPQLLDGNPYAGGMPLNDVMPNYPVTMVPPNQPPYDPYAGNMPYNDVIMAPRERLTPPGRTAPAGMGDVKYYGNGVLPPGGGNGTKAGGQGIGGQGPMPQRTPLEEIDLMYRSQLGREADEGGRNYWLQQLQGGMSPDQIQQIFRNSQEGQDYQKRSRTFTDDMGAGVGYPGGGNGTKAGGGGQPSFPFPTPGYPQNPNAPMPNMPQGNPGYPGGGNGTKAGGGGYPSGGTGTKAGGGGGYPGYPSGGNVMF